MSIAEVIKSNKSILKFGKAINIFKEYLGDAFFFSNNYAYSKVSREKLEYRMMFFVHSLEKGFCIASRPFGESKVDSLCQLINEHQKKGFSTESTAFQMALNAIDKWNRLYEEKGWKSNKQKEVIEILNNYTGDRFDIPVGCVKVNREELLCPNDGKDFEAFAASRRSVRNFSPKKLMDKDIHACVETAMRAPSACNRQMVKVFQVKDSDKKAFLDNTIKGVGGFDKSTVNYFIITYDTGSLMFYGEREQGAFNAGLFAMTFVNALHSRGIGSCFMQWSNKNSESKKVKRTLEISDSEKILCVIGAGYYAEESIIPYSFRKSVDEIFKSV